MVEIKASSCSVKLSAAFTIKVPPLPLPPVSLVPVCATIRLFPLISISLADTVKFPASPSPKVLVEITPLPTSVKLSAAFTVKFPPLPLPLPCCANKPAPSLATAFISITLAETVNFPVFP